MITMWGSGEQKKRRIWGVVILILQLLVWVSATSRPLPTPNDDGHQQGSLPEASPLTMNSKQVFVKKMERAMGDEGAYKVLSKLGSKPPSCAHRCGGCIPCNAIQVPTAIDQLDTQYANYKPEGWECKCGAAFYNP